MHIAYVVATFPQPSETFVLREIEELERQGWRVTVCALRRGASTARPDDSSRRVLYRPGPLSAPALRALCRLCLARPVRLLRLAGCLARLSLCSPRWAIRLAFHLPCAAFFAQQAGRGGIQHVHGCFANLPALVALAVSLIARLPFSMAGHARDLFVEAAPLPFLVGHARFAVTCNADAESHVRRHLPAAAQAKIHLVHHGVDLRHWRPAEPSGPSRPETTPSMLAVGRFVPKKGFDVLLQSCAELRGRGVPFHLLLVGDGPCYGTLRAMVDRCRMQDCVSLPGWLTQDDLLPFVRGAALLAVPSVQSPDGDRDGIPNVLLEAAACRVPVVASRLPGLCEVVEHGRSGLLCPPGDPAALADALQRVLQDRPLREGLAAQARLIAQARFDLARNVRRLRSLFMGGAHAPLAG